VAGLNSKATSFADSIDEMFSVSPSKSPTSLENTNSVSGRKRRRSLHFYYAQNCFSQVADCGRDWLDLEDTLNHYENWAAVYNLGRYVRLVKGDEWLFIPCVTRLMPAYKECLKKKLRGLENVKWDLKIELTVDPKQFLNLKSEFDFIGKAWPKLRRWIRWKYGNFGYLKILEVQKSGRPHLHILISGIPFIPYKDYVDKDGKIQHGLHSMWLKYGGGHGWIRSVKDDTNGAWYVLKYVKKTILGKDRVYAALLFASNRRMFSMSKDVVDFLNVRRRLCGLGWSFEGCVSAGVVRGFCNEYGLSFGGVFKVTVDLVLCHEFPELFEVWAGG